jgi:hypothetical protein
MNLKSAPILGLVVCILAASTRDAAAYIDPGSSSYVFQLLIAGLTAILFFFSTIKRKAGQLARAVFRRNQGNPRGEQAATAEPVEIPATREL